MIFRFIILGFLYILQSFVNWLPVGGLPEAAVSALQTTVGYLTGWDVLFPFDTFFEVLTRWVQFEVVVFLWHAGMWVYGRIRGIPSRVT